MSIFTEQLAAAREGVSQAILALAVALLAAVVGLGGFGFLTAALYLLLAQTLPPAGAAAVSGGVLLIVTVILLLIARSVLRPARRAGEPPLDATGARPAPANEFEALSRLAEQIGPQARRHVPLAAGLTFVAGFVLGLKPDARRALWRAVVRKF